jgi:hypothetical protein
MHKHDDPYNRFKAAADLKAQHMIYPELGEVVTF